jgi:RsiW-degrading membrane proteinase PrsW (M82 family)
MLSMPPFFLALIPCLALLYYYYNRDRHPEPWGWVAVVFVAGALSCLVAYPLERWAQSFFSERPTAGGLLLECLLIPGVIEESIKMLVVVAVVWWRPDFDDPVDGLIYGTAAALGFTFGEDWRYYLVHGHDWSRALGAAVHPWFSCFWAASLGWARVLPRAQGLGLVVLGLAASVMVHALFDFFVLAADAHQHWAWLRHLLAPLLVLLYWVMERQLDALQAARQT